MRNLDKLFIELSSLVSERENFDISSNSSNYYDLNNDSIVLDSNISNLSNPFYFRILKNYSPFFLKYIGTNDSNPYIETSGGSIYHMLPVSRINSSSILYELPLSKTMDKNVFLNYNRNNDDNGATFLFHKTVESSDVVSNHSLSNIYISRMAMGEDYSLDIDSFWKVANALEHGLNESQVIEDINFVLNSGSLVFSNSLLSPISMAQDLTINIKDMNGNLPKVMSAVIYYNLPGEGNDFITDSTPKAYENSFKHRAHLSLVKTRGVYSFKFNFGSFDDIIESGANYIYFTIKLILEGGTEIHSLINTNQNNTRSIEVCTTDLDERNNIEDLRNAFYWLKHIEN